MGSHSFKASWFSGESSSSSKSPIHYIDRLLGTSQLEMTGNGFLDPEGSLSATTVVRLVVVLVVSVFEKSLRLC